MALQWLRRHPFLGPPRLAPVDGLGTVMVFDAWQAARAMPGGGSVRLYLDVPEPLPHPPVKHEFILNRVSREVVLIDQRLAPVGRPPVREILERIYGPAVGRDHDAADPVPLTPDDVANGPSLGSYDVGPLDFEYAQARKGERYDYLEVAYRGVKDPFGGVPVEMRKTIVTVTAPSGPLSSPAGSQMPTASNIFGPSAALPSPLCTRSTESTRRGSGALHLGRIWRSRYGLRDPAGLVLGGNLVGTWLLESWLAPAAWHPRSLRPVPQLPSPPR